MIQLTLKGKQLRDGVKRFMDYVPGAASKIATILKDPKNNHLIIRLKSHMITFDHLVKVASKFGQSIEVYFDKNRVLLKDDFAGQYIAVADMLILNFQVFDTLYARSAIIHESIHCVNDMLSRNTLTILDDEFMAWTAQAMYMRLQGMTSNNVPGATNKTLLPAAFAVADSLISKHLPDDNLVKRLEAELLRLPVYRDANRTLTTQYN
jgi:hypothetical protein